MEVRGQPARVWSWPSPSTMLAQVTKLTSPGLASTFMLQSHLDGPVFRWNNFKSTILLMIIKTLPYFTLSFYKPLLTTPVYIDFAFIDFDDFSMC